MTPIGGRVLVKVVPLTEEEKIVGGILIPGGLATDKPFREGVAWAIGPDCKQIKVHNKLILPAYLAHEFDYLDEKCALLHEDEVLGIL